MSDRPLHALLCESGPAMVAAIAAALHGGPAILPLDPAAPPAARARLLDQLRPHALVDAGGTTLLPDPAPVDDDVAVVVVTSGSTGTPKGVELSAAALTHSARATLERLDAPPGARWLCCLPGHGVAGLQVVVRALLGGSRPVFAPLGGPADYVAVVPTQLTRALDAGVDLHAYRAVLLGGAAAAPALLERAAAAGVRVVTTYGMSETAGGCVYDGVPLDGVRVAVDDGRIRIAGPTLARGYRRNPSATAAAFVDGWHVTADAGRLGSDGRLAVLGRLDDVVISGGVNVSVVAVAGALASHPQVADAAAYGRVDDVWGQRVVAVVVPRPGPAPGLESLRRHVAALLGRAAAPGALVVVPTLPRLPGGKLDRAALPALTGGDQ